MHKLTDTEQAEITQLLDAIQDERRQKIRAFDFELWEACKLVVRQFDNIADDSWATGGMRVAVNRCRRVLAEIEGE